MVYQARNSDNTARTPGPYVRHDKDNAVISGGLLSENAYDKHDKDNADVTNPGSAIQTDVYGNQYYNWNADYTEHDVNNDPV